VHRLSCIIPVVGSTQGLETTLVSVLEKRPADCEILVVLNTPYADPYGLKGEIRFLEARGVGLVACATIGIQASGGEIVHLLTAGFEVTDGWADAALRHFRDPTVAAVAPLVRDAADPRRVRSTGIEYHRGGRRAVRATIPNSPHGKSAVLGATVEAAFYRKSALESLGDGLPSGVGDELADVDLALGLKYAGFRAVFEPQCEILADQLAAGEPRGFRHGLHAERLFLRKLPATGWAPSLALHPFTVAGELLKSLPRGAAFAQLLGRLAAWFSPSDYRLHHVWLRLVREAVAMEADERAVILSLPPHLQVDGSQSLTRPA
jgi:hypothetical protein